VSAPRKRKKSAGSCERSIHNAGLPLVRQAITDGDRKSSEAGAAIRNQSKTPATNRNGGRTTMKDINAWTTYDAAQEAELEQLCRDYMRFLNEGKTERECVRRVIADAEEAGYRDLGGIIREGGSVKPGDRVYAACMKKTIALFQIGSAPIEEGMNILGAHIDSPRLDVKQNPLYEDGGIAYLDTHYYGGIKKYQWVTIPLAIHGVAALRDGTVRDIVIGEDEDDPVFFVSDLLIHLAGQQMEKKARSVIDGEALDIIVGTRPPASNNEEDSREADKAVQAGGSAAASREAAGEEDEAAAKDAVKKRVLELIKEKYGLEEDDFWSAELEVVPAARAREAGLDRSLILSYGQDDRVCAYTSLAAMLETKDVTRTACCLLVDKEEIGSVGATGMQSRFFENTVAELLQAMGAYSELTLRRTLAHSRMLSSDVSAAFDPTYAAKFDKKNAALLGCGMVFNKFTGARGKSGSNDANAEYLGRLREILHRHDVRFQSAELGRVDVGGGGTIAYIMSLYGMEVVDSGVAVLNMHAPYEATSKADIYETKKGYLAFLADA
jgi:aspartyl aminopeptidase